MTPIIIQKTSYFKLKYYIESSYVGLIKKPPIFHNIINNK